MPEETKPEEKRESPEIIGKEATAFLSPEAIIMMGIAIFADVGEFFIEFVPVIGQFLSVVIDIITLLFVGGWMFFRSGTIRVKRKTAVRMDKASKWAKRLKWLRPLCAVIEMIPGIGSLPLWTVAVYFELKYGKR